jgi:hypothetical protein
VEVNDMSPQTITIGTAPSAGYPTSYREVKIGKILYRVTSVYKGEIDLKNALEDLAVRRALRESETASRH